MPLCFDGFRVGTAGQPDVVGVMATGSEDLLPVDDVLVALANRGGAQRCQVGACLWFGVADREVHLTGEDRGQELLLLRSLPYTCSVGADGLQRHGGQRYVGAVGLVDEDLIARSGRTPRPPNSLGQPTPSLPSGPSA